MEAVHIGPYRLERLLGFGGMGEVHLAYDTSRDRLVALKLLPETLGRDPEYQQRFRRESHVAARLRDPHVVPIHDYGEIDGHLYIDMRLVEGRNIRQMLEDDGSLEPTRAVHLMGQIGEALEAAHADGLVHRDVKPSNVLVTANDFVYVVDFGIARSVGTNRTSLTLTGVTVGTLDYMAPERFSTKGIDGRADVYSMACLLYECITSMPPFAGDDLATLMYAHLFSDPPTPSTLVESVGPAMDAVIAKGMAKALEDRFTTPTELVRAARAALIADAAAPTPRPTPTPAPRPAAPDDGATQVVTPPARERSQPSAADHAAPTTAFPSPRPRASSGSRPVDLPTVVVGNVPSTAAPTAAAIPARPRPHSGPHLPPLPPRSAPSGSAGAPRPGSRRGRLVGAIATVVAVLLVAGVLVVTTGLLGSSNDEGGSTGASPSTTPVVNVEAAAPPVEVDPVAPSLAVPTVQGIVPVGGTPGYMEIAPNGRFAYIAGRDSLTVTVLDLTINQVTATIPVPEGPPQFVSFSPDGTRAYISIYNTDRTVNLVAVLDTATNSVLDTIPVGRRPFASSTTPDGSLLYVPSHDDGRIDVIDTESLTVVRELPVAPNPHWVVFNADGTLLYMANHESNLVSVLDPATDTVIATIPVGTSPHSITISPDGTRVSVVNFDSSEVSVIDTATNQVVATVRVGTKPQDIAYAADGRFLYTANVDSDTISVIDTTTYQVTASIPAGDGPTSVAVTPDGLHAYVTELNDGVVMILDLTAA